MGPRCGPQAGHPLSVFEIEVATKLAAFAARSSAPIQDNLHDPLLLLEALGVVAAVAKRLAFLAADLEVHSEDARLADDRAAVLPLSVHC